MTIAELMPDVALKELLDGNVKVDSEAKAVKVYAQGEQPNVGVDDDYITILYNGTIRSLTTPMGLFSGNLALSIHSKLYTNRTINLKRMRRMLGQCMTAMGSQSNQRDQRNQLRYFFRLDPVNVITPPTPNDTTGYATMTINVKWRSY